MQYSVETRNAPESEREGCCDSTKHGAVRNRIFHNAGEMEEIEDGGNSELGFIDIAVPPDFSQSKILA
jgi:hypothetical protein